MNESDQLSITRRNWLQSAAFVAALPLTAWGTTSSLGIPEEDEDDDEETAKKYKTKIETRFIGDHTTFGGVEPVVLEGVGLVRGLSGTGGDPSPSQYRTVLLEDLKKRRYRHPDVILASPDTALVIVQAYLHPLMKKGDRIDVKVTIPGHANATSLVGGELLATRLSDRAIVEGRYMEGKVYVIAQGPVLTEGLGASALAEPALLKKGRVLSGGVVAKEREFALYLKNDFKTNRNVERVSEAIGRRFHDFNEHGIKKSLATPKTDQKLILAVHPHYKNDTARYRQVIRHLAYRETPVELRVRMNRLKHDLMVPELSGSSALQLEAIGTDAIPILKHGLLSPLLECRFHSACALAYLGDSSGLPALVESAKNERAFRVFALSAMSVIEDPDSHLALRELMNEPIEETRYGAFRALWTLDRNDPFIRGETLGLRENDEDHDHIYKLHVLKTSGPPLVHVTLRTRPEITLFGADQEFSTPLYGKAGKHIVVTAQPGAKTISLARFEVGKPDLKKESSLRVADLIRTANDLGATYPDILQLLADASKQKNLPTDIAADKLPAAARVYYRPANGTKGGSRKIKIGRENFSPNAFPDIEDPEEAERRREKSRLEENQSENGGSMASVPLEDSINDVESDPTTKAFKKKDRSSKTADKSKSPWSWLSGGK